MSIAANVSKVTIYEVISGILEKQYIIEEKKEFYNGQRLSETCYKIKTLNQKGNAIKRILLSSTR